jgi:hypothetical protein
MESSIWIYDKLNLRNFNITLNKQKVNLTLIGQYNVQTNVGQMWQIEFYTCLDILSWFSFWTLVNIILGDN